MHALKPGRGDRAGISAQPDTRRAGLAAGVLPRVLRRPVRALSRLDPGALRIPRYAMSALTAGLFSLAGIYGASVGGHYPEIVKTVTATSGFAVVDVRISGHRETSEIDVLDKLGLDGWTSLVGLDADAARERVVSLPWVRSASVRKIYPDGIDIAIVEKRPFAIWQHQNELTLIDRTGLPIAPFRGDRYATLPLVVGAGAAEKAATIVTRTAVHPGLASRVRGYVLVAGRRWDLRLENGVTIKLPEHGEAAALAELAALDESQGLLTRDIAAVDLRLDDRFVVQLTPEALERRGAELKARGKKRPGTERRI